MLQFAVKTNNYELFNKCHGQMAEFFSHMMGQITQVI